MPGLTEMVDPLDPLEEYKRRAFLERARKEWFTQPLPMQGRATFLPFMDTAPGSVMNERSWAVPGALAALLNAVTAPGRAYSGQLDPMSPEGMEEGANFAGTVLGSGTLSGMLGAAPKGSGILGLNVWHGSPHRYDKFDASKIGTGQGAQAYGHGLYVAENRAVANSPEYRTPEAGYRRLSGHMTPKEEFAFDLLSQGRHPDDVWNTMVQKYGRQSAETAEFQDAYDAAVKAAKGYLYKVDLPDEMIGRMLDWDKPLSQQPESVRRAVRELLDFHQPSGSVVNANRSTGYARFDQDLTGAQARELLELKLGKGGADKVFRDAGIPGIKYLDQGSRAAGEGTRNFVVFPGNEEFLSILSRE